MQPRRGVTLTEVLVAVFVLGISLVALMTLFPLGASNMAQAIQDDRASQCAVNAAAFLRVSTRSAWENGAVDTNIESSLAANKAVYYDPLGVQAGAGASVAGTMPRVGVTGLTFPQAQRWFTLLDDVTLQANGSLLAPGGVASRRPDYSWAYVLRMLGSPNAPAPGLPAQYARAIDYSVVVYKGRGFVPIGETPTAVTAAAGSTAMSVGISVKKEAWILDATNGYFYQATAVNGGTVELNNPIRATFSTAVVFDNVVRVFDRSTLE